MIKLKQLINEIQVNRNIFDAEIDDEFDDFTILSISYKGEHVGDGHYNSTTPEVINVEFLFEENNDESKQMDELISILTKKHIPFEKRDVNGDGILIYIQIPKNIVNIKPQ